MSKHKCLLLQPLHGLGGLGQRLCASTTDSSRCDSPHGANSEIIQNKEEDLRTNFKVMKFEFSEDKLYGDVI